MSLDPTYWDNRYRADDMPWDAGTITAPLKAYADQLTARDLKILIPGAGYGYEPGYLFDQGFTDVHLLDFADEPLAYFKAKYPSFPAAQLHQGDFFKHTGQYDLIIEQTFFCALEPSLRTAYAKHMHELLKPGGKLVGVMFNAPFPGGPPFGGSAEEYKTYFEPYFEFKTFEACYNSIKPREGTELFVILVKRA